MMTKLWNFIRTKLFGKNKKQKNKNKDIPKTKVVNIAPESMALCELLILREEDDFSSNYNDTLLYLLNKSEKIDGVPYDAITKVIFEDVKMEELENIRYRVEQRLSPVIDNNIMYHTKFRGKFLKHVNLSITQKQHISNSTEKAKKMAEEAQTTVEKSQKQLEDMEQTKERIYTDFVSILGIFTAITFATFGGLQLLGNVFGNIKDITFNNIGGTLILGSIFVAGTYLLLIALFSGISKISNVKRGYRPSKAIAVLLLSFCGLLIYFGLKTMTDSHNGLIKNDDVNKNDTYNINFTQKPDISSSQKSSESK